MGAQESTLTLNVNGAQLTGTQSAPSGDSSPIAEGKVNGNKVAWKASITKPVSLTLEFSGNVNGNQLSGEVKLGMFGSSTFSGTRA
jgi:autotransporter translocation and assembly factor TamB